VKNDFLLHINSDVFHKIEDPEELAVHLPWLCDSSANQMHHLRQRVGGRDNASAARSYIREIASTVFVFPVPVGQAAKYACTPSIRRLLRHAEGPVNERLALVTRSQNRGLF
jgi:hypothetical protein